MNCNYCGRFIHAEFDGENVLGTCCYCDTVSIDIVKTNEVWDYIDTQRINEDTAWINELNKCDVDN